MDTGAYGMTFEQLKQCYEEFSIDMIRRNRVLVKDTAKGIWGICDLNDVNDLFKTIRIKRFKSFLDIGSGDGRVVLLASMFGLKATGIEIDKELNDAGKAIAKQLKLRCNLICDDYMKHDFSKYDILFINPDKGFHLGLEDKLLKELKGRLFVYNKIFQPRFLKLKRTYDYYPNIFEFSSL